MNNLLLFFRILLFFLSLAGYALFLQKQYDIPYGFGICIAASSIISILWICGMFFSITLSIYILYGMGLVLFLQTAIKNSSFLSSLMNWTNLFLAITVLLAIYFILGKRFWFIDDFNHWATIARSIFENQALPDANDELIAFISYPPGAALWISYYLTVVGSSSEDMYLFAQAILILIYLCPSIAGINSNKTTSRKPQLIQGIMIYLIILLGAFCFTLGTGFKTLCVDGLLAAAGIGLVCFILNYNGSNKKRVLFSIPLFISVISIKDYGLLFSLWTSFMLIAFLIKKNQSLKENLILGSIPLASIGIIELLWQNHVSKTFVQIADAPHSLNISRWLSTFQSRSSEEIKIIFDLFIQEIFARGIVIPFLGIMGTLFFCYLLVRQKNPSETINTKIIIIFIVSNYLVFLLSLAFVYLFSMEIEGAIRLESFYRYTHTELCFLFGTCISYLINILFLTADHSKYGNLAIPCAKKLYSKYHGILNTAVILFACLCPILTMPINFEILSNYNNNYWGSSRERIHQLTSEEYTGDLLIYAPSLMDGYYEEFMIWSVSSYDFRTNAIDVVTLDDIDGFESKLFDYSHILLYDVDEQMESYLRGENWTGKIDCGLYCIKDDKIMNN